jgi:hypothetical protein
MPIIAKWSVWSKFYVISLLLYSALLCFVSTKVFVAAVQQHSPLKASDIVIQALMTLFLPMLILGIWKPRLTSGLLFAGAATDLALMLSTYAHPGNMSGMLSASLLFLGFPMLASAILFHLISRTSARTLLP